MIQTVSELCLNKIQLFAHSILLAFSGMMIGVVVLFASTSIRILEVAREAKAANFGSISTLGSLGHQTAPFIVDSILISDYNINFTVNYAAASKLIQEADPRVLSLMMLFARFIEAFISSTTSYQTGYVFVVLILITISTVIYGFYWSANFRQEDLTAQFVDRTVAALENSPLFQNLSKSLSVQRLNEFSAQRLHDALNNSGTSIARLSPITEILGSSATSVASGSAQTAARKGYTKRGRTLILRQSSVKFLISRFGALMTWFTSLFLRIKSFVFCRQPPVLGRRRFNNPLSTPPRRQNRYVDLQYCQQNWDDACELGAQSATLGIQALQAMAAAKTPEEREFYSSQNQTIQKNIASANEFKVNLQRQFPDIHFNCSRPLDTRVQLAKFCPQVQPLVQAQPQTPVQVSAQNQVQAQMQSNLRGGVVIKEHGANRGHMIQYQAHSGTLKKLFNGVQNLNNNMQESTGDVSGIDQ